MSKEIATFAAGCFWGIEYKFSKIAGVLKATSGYMGGNLDNPSYEAVCTDETGHAEVVQVEFEAEIISYFQLLEAFWKMHDPTQINRQGPDEGTQYRSAIFFHTPEQSEIALKSKKDLDASRVHPQPIATLIEPATHFWPAEEYHQKYLEKHPEVLCHI